MRMTLFCNHYRAMSEHKTCAVGVAYAAFQGVPFDQRPCFCENGQQPPGGCEHAQFPTAEELASEEAEIQERCANIGKARQAIVAHLGGPWKKGTPGAGGAIDCPVCQGVKSLRFSRAGYNGHIAARCSTVNCVNWME